MKKVQVVDAGLFAFAWWELNEVYFDFKVGLPAGWFVIFTILGSGTDSNQGQRVMARPR